MVSSQAVLLVADKNVSFELTGNGDVLEPKDGIMGERGIPSEAGGRVACSRPPPDLTSLRIGIGSGGPYALAAARALSDLPEMDAVQIAQMAMDVASDLCVYTNKEFITETLDTEDEKAE